VAEQTRREDASVVDDHQVAGPKQIRQVRDQPVIDRAGLAPESQQTRGGALRRRFLGNEFRRKLIVELADIHPPAILTN
jgi:hypothetical protein